MVWFLNDVFEFLFLNTIIIPTLHRKTCPFFVANFFFAGEMHASHLFFHKLVQGHVRHNLYVKVFVPIPIIRQPTWHVKDKISNLRHRRRCLHTQRRHLHRPLHRKSDQRQVCGYSLSFLAIPISLRGQSQMMKTVPSSQVRVWVIICR